MAATKPTRGNRAKTNTVKRAKPKVNPMDKKPKTTATKKTKAIKKNALGGGNGKTRKNA